MRRICESNRLLAAVVVPPGHARHCLRLLKRAEGDEPRGSGSAIAVSCLRSFIWLDPSLDVSLACAADLRQARSLLGTHIGRSPPGGSCRERRAGVSFEARGVSCAPPLFAAEVPVPAPHSGRPTAPAVATASPTPPPRGRRRRARCRAAEMSLKRLKAPHSAVRQVIFDDLRLAEVGPQAREELIARAVPVVGNGDGVLHDEACPPRPTRDGPCSRGAGWHPPRRCPAPPASARGATRSRCTC